MKTQTPVKDMKQKAARKGSRGACAGLVGMALQACVHAQPPMPVVRPEPAPQPCPAGAWESMKALGVVEAHNWPPWRAVRFPPTPGSDPVEQAGNYIITVHEGPTSAVMSGHWGTLLNGTLVYGQLLFGEKRVYGRFTRAQTPDGQMHTVCLELTDTSDHPGLEIEPTSREGAIRVFTLGSVHPVRSFE